ncbi:MAG: DUF4870 domain-containing protein [Xanthomonadaceae bacterium]|jgi:hypothetical protein|nr:DUF4870 domain-containing protein [Xanthomonadaceae bacterium]
MSDDASQTVPESPPPRPQADAPPPDTVGTIGEKDRPLAVMTHLSALVGYLIPLANLIIPLVIWLVKRNDSPDIDAVGREVVNFNLSMLLYAFFGFLLTFVLVGFLVLFGLWLFGIVVTIIAALRANDGWRYRYPLTIRFF